MYTYWEEFWSLWAQNEWVLQYFIFFCFCCFFSFCYTRRLKWCYVNVTRWKVWWLCCIISSVRSCFYVCAFFLFANFSIVCILLNKRDIYYPQWRMWQSKRKIAFDTIVSDLLSLMFWSVGFAVEMFHVQMSNL